MTDASSRLVAGDVQFSPGSDSRHVKVARPGVRTVLELTVEESFLVAGMQQPYNEVVLHAKYKSKFGKMVTAEELQDLMERLETADLLAGDQPRKETSNERGGTASLLPEDDSRSRPCSDHWSLGDPQCILDALLPFFAPFRHLFFLAVPLLILVATGVIKNLDSFQIDISDLESRVSFIGRVIFVLFTINLMTQLYRGLVARHFGLSTPSLRLRLALGLVPRFHLVIEHADNLDRQKKLFLLSAPLVSQIFLFFLGAILWLTTRELGTAMHQIGAALAMLSLSHFLLLINPLLEGAGYHFLREYFALPNLRKLAFARFKAVFLRQPEVLARYGGTSPAVLIYGLLSLLFTALLVGVVAYSAARWLKLNYQGLGISLFFCICAYLAVRFGSPLFFGQKETRTSTFARAGDLDGRPGKRSKFFRYGLTLLLLLVCFLPYRYHSGGAAEIFPIATARIYADYPDIIQTIHYNGGEYLKKGTVVAELANDRQKHDVDRLQAEIRKKEEDLNILLTTPLPEQISLAREELKERKISTHFSQKKLEMIARSHAQNASSYSDYLDALRRAELDQQAVRTSQASLDYIANQVNEHQISATRAELEILREKLVYCQGVLDRTRLKMPITGQIVTMNLKNRQRSYLDTGEMLASVDDTSSVRVEIQIPEGDIGDVTVGSPIEFKLLAYPSQPFSCNVKRVYPVAEENTFGRYQVCECVLVNDHGKFSAGMTGFAKIESREMFLVAAFTRSLVRFVKIEVWSWIP